MLQPTKRDLEEADYNYIKFILVRWGLKSLPSNSVQGFYTKAECRLQTSENRHAWTCTVQISPVEATTKFVAAVVQVNLFVSPVVRQEVPETWQPTWAVQIIPAVLRA
jgi:hypothetical protein